MTEFFKMIRNFLLDYLPIERKYSKHTVKSYKDVLKLFISFLQKEKKLKLTDITFSIISKDTVIEFLGWLQKARGCGATSRNQRLSVLRSFFLYAAERDCTLISLSVALQNEVKAQKHSGKMIGYLSEPALKALLDQPDSSTKIGLRNMTFMVLLYDTGARCSEILNLRVCDVHIKNTIQDVYMVGKGQKPRVAPLLPKTVSHIERYLKEFHPNYTPHSEDLLFYTVIHGRRGPMSADTIATFMKKYGEMARVVCDEVPERVHPHMMRHTRAMHYYREGMPLVLLSEYLGHADVATTRVYAFADTEMKRTIMKKVEPNQHNTPDAIPIWENDDAMMLRLSGLN